MLHGISAAFADPMNQWAEYGSNPVYDQTPTRAYYPTVIKEGSTYTMWSDSGSGVQVATSTDGINWTNTGTATGLTNPAHTLVEKIGTDYRMWYWNTSQLYSINAMRTATSTDGLSWSNDQAITQVGSSVIDNSISTNWNRGSYGPADVIYNPSGSSTIVNPVDEASVWANKYVMYYDGTTGGEESLGLAVSNNAINWQGYNGGTNPTLAGTGVSGDWDEDFVSRGTVLVFGSDDYRMWFSGGTGAMNQGIGFALSTDGISWTRDTDSIFHIDDNVAWRDVRTYTPMVVDDMMWFSGRSSAGAYTIGLANVVPEPATWVMLGMAGTLFGLWRVRRGILRKRK